MAMADYDQKKAALTVMRPATLADVARLAGVVAMTASRALNNQDMLVRMFVNASLSSRETQIQAKYVGTSAKANA